MFRSTAPFNYNAVHPYISLEKVGVYPLVDYSIEITLDCTLWMTIVMLFPSLKKQFETWRKK